MSLVHPQSVLVKWSTASKKHFINLGYTFSKFGDVFMCDISQLPQYSEIEVDIECDFCHLFLKIPYKRALKLKSDRYCCTECLSHKKKTRDQYGNLCFIEIPYRNKEWLYKRYIVDNAIAPDIAKECSINVRTLREWISTFGLVDLKNKTEHITKEDLHKLYVKDRLTALEIGKIYGVTDGTILALLRKNEIEIPNRSELMRRYFYEKNGIEKFRKMSSSDSYRIMKSCTQRGISEESFDGFLRSENERIRNSSLYREWRRKVFSRDDFTCQRCGVRGGHLNAHHIENFSDNHSLRLDLANGVTLCECCHSVKYPNSFHSIYGEKRNNAKQLFEFLNSCEQKGGACG